MTKHFNSLTILTVTALLLADCSAPKKTEETSEEAEEQVMEIAPVITLTKAPASPAYEDASLALSNLSVEQAESSFSATFDFEVANYELGTQTEDAATRGIANSGKGQHIHFIVDNGPYSAHYEPTFTKEMEAGNYVILAFLSRSYHESVKNENAYFVQNVTVGEVEKEEADLSAPHLFYSRPKGSYKGADTEKLMLDFYLLNTTISPEGNKVKATINGNEFLIDEWAPHYIEGAPKGELTVKLELIDNEGNAIEGPFNSVERKVMLE